MYFQSSNTLIIMNNINSCHTLYVFPSFPMFNGNKKIAKITTIEIIQSQP